jgi:hypothetical protein
MMEADNINLDNAVAVLRSVAECGCATATYDESEACFFCGAQVNWCAPRTKEEHAAGCAYVVMLEFLYTIDGSTFSPNPQ